MEILKLLMTTDTYPPYSNGGDANHVFLLSHELASKGHDVHIISSINAYSMLSKRFNWKPNKPEKNGVCVHTYLLDSPRGDIEPILTYVFGSSKFYDAEYKKIVDKIRPDIVHHHDITFLGHSLFKRLSNYSQLYTAHNYWLICPNRESFRFGNLCEKPSLCTLCMICSKRIPQVWRWKIGGKDVIKDVIKDIDVMIAPSEYMKQRLEIGLNKKITYLPNFIPHPKKDIASSGYTNYLLYVGQLEERKGIMKLLNVFRKYSREIDASLIIVGSGSIEFKIRDFIKKNRMEKKILLLGRVDKDILWSLYNDAIALVVPSIWPENNPLVAIEALSLGTPVIGTDAGGLGEIIKKIDKNLIFKEEGFEEIRMFLENKSYYSKDMIKNIYNEWYSPEKYLKEYDILCRAGLYV